MVILQIPEGGFERSANRAVHMLEEDVIAGCYVHYLVVFGNSLKLIDDLALKRSAGTR